MNFEMLKKMFADQKRSGPAGTPYQYILKLMGQRKNKNKPQAPAEANNAFVSAYEPTSRNTLLS